MTEETIVPNKYMVLVCGKSTTGKSHCLRNLRNPEGVWYLNTESGKALPFPSKFQEIIITDPSMIIEGIEESENDPNCHTVVIDSLTFAFDMWISQNIVHAEANESREQWKFFADFFRKLFNETCAKSTKNLIFTAHTLETEAQADKRIMELKVPVAGQLKNNGIEAFFSTIVATKKIPNVELKPYANPLLTYRLKEKRKGFKHVFQTDVTTESLGERMRGVADLWTYQETYIDNDLQHVIDRLHNQEHFIALNRAAEAKEEAELLAKEQAKA